MKKYYEYSQNNSGGGFIEPAVKVYIAAESAKEADKVAIKNGIYFDGVDNEIDCDCCGDRWYRAWDDGALKEPDVDNDNAKWWSEREGIPATLVIEKEDK